MTVGLYFIIYNKIKTKKIKNTKITRSRINTTNTQIQDRSSSGLVHASIERGGINLVL